jgi:rubrerythrin
VNRRSVLKTAAASTAAAALFSGSAAATNPRRINFCGCHKVCLDSERDEPKGTYWVLVAEETGDKHEYTAVRRSAAEQPFCYETDGSAMIIGVLSAWDCGHRNPSQCAEMALEGLWDVERIPVVKADGSKGAASIPTEGIEFKNEGFGMVKDCRNSDSVEIVRGGCGDSDGGDDGKDEVTDVEVLNYALTLEHLEYAFYRDGLEQYGEGAFTDAGFPDDARERLMAVRDHEETHVDTLTQVISDLGGDPVGEACYDFGYESPGEFVGIAKVLENTGVSAYDGAIHLIDNPDLVTAGATIATVEARHAAYLNDLNGVTPFPAAFDEPLSMEEVLEAAGGFIVPCE